MRHIVLAFALVFATNLASQEVKPLDLTDYEVLASVLKTGSVKNLIVVDVRSKELYRKSHIPKAINIPLDELWDKVPPKSGIQPVLVLYGRPASVDVKKAYDILTSNGFTNVIIFGSISFWKGDLQ